MKVPPLTMVNQVSGIYHQFIWEEKTISWKQQLIKRRPKKKVRKQWIGKTLIHRKVNCQEMIDCCYQDEWSEAAINTPLFD